MRAERRNGAQLATSRQSESVDALECRWIDSDTLAVDDNLSFLREFHDIFAHGIEIALPGCARSPSIDCYKSPRCRLWIERIGWARLLAKIQDHIRQFGGRIHKCTAPLAMIYPESVRIQGSFPANRLRESDLLEGHRLFLRNGGTFSI